MKPASTQSDRNMNFDGIGEGPGKGSSKYAGNKWSGHSNDGRTVNYGRGPTTGNNGSEPTAKNTGAPVTKDAFRRAPDSASGKEQKRNPGGTRTWEPSKTQNYKGNPDMIRAKQTGGPGYGQVTRGSTPSTAKTQSDFNYGPKKQY